MSAAEIRRAGPDDTGRICELNGIGSGDHIATEMETVFRLGGMAPSDYAVAVVDGEVVSTVGLLATHLRVGSVILPAGQPEYIATDPDHRGLGLVRRLLELVQEWSEARGDLVQIIGGVPYFYRQYGYSYGLVRPPELAVPPDHDLALPAGWQVRAAGREDVDRIRALQDSAQARADVALPYADNLWPALLDMPAAPLLVGVTDGRVEAVARLRVSPGKAVPVQAIASSNAYAVAGVHAVLAGARARYPGTTLIVADREGSTTRAVVAPAAVPVAGRKWFYTRVPSLHRLLTALTPVLDQRLAGSAYAEQDGELTISLYRSSVRLTFDKGRIVDVSAGPAVHEPEESGCAAVPPDLVPELLFGEGGVMALAGHPDVHLGRFQPLMATLFPPLRVDLLTW